MKKIKRALISVSDKKSLKDLLKILTKYKIELISSGGTYKEIKKLKFKCLEVSEYTGSPSTLVDGGPRLQMTASRWLCVGASDCPSLLRALCVSM